MPNNEDHEQSDSAGEATDYERLNKRRRLQGACDTCRRKKIKCDSAVTENKICSNCINSKVPCTHEMPRKKKKDSQQDYIRALEERLRRMEDKLRGSPSDFHSPTVSSSSPASQRQSTSPGLDVNLYPDLPIPVPRTVPDINTVSTSPTPADANGDDDDAHIRLAENLKNLSMEPHEDRFFGKSSMISFAQEAVMTRREYGDVSPSNEPVIRREYFWGLRQWEGALVHERPPKYVFPDTDLLHTLIEIYFERIHIVYPAVHRQSFERKVRNLEHLTDPQFGMVVLAVCALGSRHSDDPRVFMAGDDSDGVGGSSAGWKYITQVPMWRNSICNRTSSYDMHFYALAAFYYTGTSMPQICWSLAGLGLRLAVERGLHRRKGADYKPNVGDEAEKRAFWCLVACDRMQSSFLGRPSALHDEDIDCDYPIDCDDEYWEAEDPSVAFKQPPSKPNYATSFIYNLKLFEILGFMSRTLYSIKKSKIMTGLIGEDWETRVVTELDSSLNKWKHSLPRHLAWDPSNPDLKFYNQSLFLHTTFYFIQIQVHRPFLKGQSPLSSASLAICTNAARACSHVVECAMKRQQYTYPNVLMAAFLAAMVLTVNFWSSRQSKITYDPVKEMADIERCRAFMLQAEKRWYIAGRLRDMITEFSYVRGPAFVEVPGQTANRSNSNKRSRPGTIDLSSVQTPNFFKTSFSADTASPLAVTASSMATFSQYRTKVGVPAKPAPVAPSYPQPSIPELTPSLTDNNQRPLPSPNVTMEQWDLSSLLLAQMGYDQPLGNNFPVPVPNMVQGSSMNMTSSIPFNAANVAPMVPDAFIPLKGLPSTFTDTSAIQDFAANEAMDQGGYDFADPLDMSAWMSAPTSFSLEEWDNFIAATGGPLVQ